MRVYISVVIMLFVTGLSNGQSSDSSIKTNINAIKASKGQQTNRNGRYRLNNKRKNFFNTKKNRIKLIIPVTDKKLKYGGVVNISSEDISAILVWIKGKPKRTPCSPIRKKVRKRKLKISEILGLDLKQLNKKNELVVAIFNNETCSKGDIKDIKDIITSASSYQNAVDDLNTRNDCSIQYEEFSKGKLRKSKDEVDKKPKEVSGDIINGN